MIETSERVRRPGTLFLGALGAALPLSIDMGLPALPAIGESLGSTAAAAALTLTLFMAGFACAPLGTGPLSDRYGRRPVLLGGAVLFTIAGLACTLAPTLGWLLAARFVQGAGAGTGAVLLVAIVRDVYEGAEGRVQLAYVRMVQTIAPVVAPSIGAALLALGGWRVIYGALAACGAALTGMIAVRFEEPARASRFAGGMALRTVYGRVLRTRASMTNIVVNGLSFGCMFAYIAGSPLVMLEVAGLSPREYGLLFATTASGIMCGALVSGRLNRRGAAPWRVMGAGLMLQALAGLALLAVTWRGVVSVWGLAPMMVLATFSLGLIAPNAGHGAVEPLPEIAGAASAVLSFTQMVCGAAATAAVGALFDGRSGVGMAGVMAGFGVGALVVGWVGKREAYN